MRLCGTIIISPDKATPKGSLCVMLEFIVAVGLCVGSLVRTGFTLEQNENVRPSVTAELVGLELSTVKADQKWLNLHI